MLQGHSGVIQGFIIPLVFLMLYGRNNMQMTWLSAEGDGGSFVELCRRRGLNVNADKSNVMVLNGKEGLESETDCTDGQPLRFAGF